MQAIQTKYHGPTNCKGSRIIAKCAAQSMVWHWRDELNIEQNHIEAAKCLANTLKWLDKNKLESGCLKDNSYVHVMVAI